METWIQQAGLDIIFFMTKWHRIEFTMSGLIWKFIGPAKSCVQLAIEEANVLLDTELDGEDLDKEEMDAESLINKLTIDISMLKRCTVEVKKKKCVITLQKLQKYYSAYYTRATQNYKPYYTKLQTVLHWTTLYR